jgi:hypothetical protein
VRIVSGIPKRSMATVVPAAPGTVRAAEPATATGEKKSKSPPTSNWAFSSSVIADITSLILSFVSLGACADAFRLITVIRVKIDFFIKRGLKKTP